MNEAARVAADQAHRPGAIAGIVHGDRAIEDQPGATRGEDDLVAMVGVAPVLHDHVGVRLKELHELLVCRHRLAVEDSPRGLVDHARDAREHGNKMRTEAIMGGRRGQALAMDERTGRVARCGLGQLDQLAMARAPLPRWRHVQDLHRAPLRAFHVSAVCGRLAR